MAKLERSTRLAGKVALITGVGAGIGQGCASMFARHGATVIGCDLNLNAAEATAESAACDDAPLAGVFACDLTNEDEVSELVAKACGPRG